MATVTNITDTLPAERLASANIDVFERWLSATVFNGQELPHIEDAQLEAAMENVAAGKPAFVATGYSNAIAASMIASLNGQSCCGLEPSSRLSRLHTQIQARKPAWLERYSWPTMLAWLTPVNEAGRQALAWELSLHKAMPAASAA